MVKSRQITNEEKRYLLNLKQDDITLDKMKELFAYTRDRDPMFNPTDTMTLNTREYHNERTEVTTVGRFIFNKLVLEPKIIELLGYINMPMDNGNVKKMDKELSTFLIKEELTVREYSDYIDRINWLGYSCNNFLVSSLNHEFYTEPEKVTKRKKELFQEHQEELDKGNIVVMEQIENELLDLAKHEVEDNPAFEIFDSGSRGSFSNNYKNSVITRGAITDPVDNTFHISTASLVEGIPKEDYHIYANMIVAGSYSRAKNTEIGGYTGKKLHYAFQHMSLDEAGSDCGTRKTIEIKIDDFNSEMLMYRYIVEGGKLVLLDNDNMDKYIGKTVQMRSPMYCISDKFCSKCAGELYYKIGIKNVGLLMNRKGTTLMQLSMKLFHDTTVKLSKINIEDYITELK